MALPRLTVLAEPAPEATMAEPIEDDELRLIFTCCHPVLPADARVALTLREVAGLTPLFSSDRAWSPSHYFLLQNVRDELFNGRGEYTCRSEWSGPITPS
jgi:hypothetical protein